MDWMLHILARNLLATWVICGFWDWFLYFSPIQKKLHKYKMNPVYPSFAQIKHDALVTTTASCAAGGIEIILCHLWATGKLTLTTSLSDAPYLNLAMALLLTHYRIPHFHLIHRAMHPWKTTNFPDIGKFLYRQVWFDFHGANKFLNLPLSGAQSSPQVVQPDRLLWYQHAPCRVNPVLLRCSYSGGFWVASSACFGGHCGLCHGGLART